MIGTHYSLSWQLCLYRSLRKRWTSLPPRYFSNVESFERFDHALVVEAVEAFVASGSAIAVAAVGVGNQASESGFELVGVGLLDLW